MDRSSLDTPWRRMASSVYRRPRDSKIFGSVELDVTELEAFVLRKRGEGVKMTLTHAIFLALGRSIRDRVPEFNATVKRGRIIPRSGLAGGLAVLQRASGDMTLVRVDLDDDPSIDALSFRLREQLQGTIEGKEDPSVRIKQKLAVIPWPLRTWLLDLIAWLSLDLGLQAPGLGLDRDRFGCFILSNIGSIGLDVGFPALLPNANVAAVITMGIVHDRVEWMDGETTPRRKLTLSATMDHRLVDGQHGGRLFNAMKRYAADPTLLDKSPGKPITT
jgi:hypothetical protein